MTFSKTHTKFQKNFNLKEEEEEDDYEEEKEALESLTVYVLNFKESTLKI